MKSAFLKTAFCAITIASTALAQTPAPRKFTFPGIGESIAGYTPLTTTDKFDAARGYGFDLETAPTEDEKSFFFSANVPEGNYKITVVLGDKNAASNNTIKAESRQLLLENIVTRAGEFSERSFFVNVRNSHVPPPEKNAPGGSAVVLNERETGLLRWDDKLTLEFNGRAPHVRSVVIEHAQVPTVFLIGDSTVTDQPYEPAASWGQMLPRFLQGVAVANHAESGETMKSFISGLRLAKVLSQIKSGDYLFIQFGHNDSKKQWPQTYVEAHTTYKAYLRTLIAEARLRDVTPVLITSMQRRNFDHAGKIVNSHGDYPQTVREVAAEEKVALIDLEKMSVAFYEALGPVKSPLAFSAGGKDITHHNNYGGYELAKCIVQGIRDAKLPLAQLIAPDFEGFDPARPDLPDTFSIAASPLHSTATIRGN